MFVVQPWFIKIIRFNDDDDDEKQTQNPIID